jgi:hypothetical protein
MRKLLLWLGLFLAGTCSAQAQSLLPNLRVTAPLSVACANASTSCAGTANSALDISSANYNVVTITVAGTYSGATVNFDFSDDGGTTYFQDLCARNDSNVTEVSEVLPTNQTRSWDCAVYATNRFRVRLAAISSGTVNVAITISEAPIEPVMTTNLANTVGSTDPCQNSSVLKSSAAINISTATTTQLVAPSGSTAVYVCGFSFTISEVVTTANTLQFEAGTGGTCGAATVVKSGLYGAGGVTAGIPIVVASPGMGSTVFSSAAASGVCAVTAIGATGSFQGLVTFVQQ